MIKVRKYKNYTGIYLTEISEKAFIESRKIRDELRNENKNTVVRITKKASEDFFKERNLIFDDVKDNDVFSFLGSTFKVIKAKDECGLTKVGYYTRNINDTELEEKGVREWRESWMWGNVARSFLEISYKNTTGNLLFF